MTLTKQKCLYKKTYIYSCRNESAQVSSAVAYYVCHDSEPGCKTMSMVKASHIFRALQLSVTVPVSLSEHVQRGTAVLHCVKREPDRGEEGSYCRPMCAKPFRE